MKYHWMALGLIAALPLSAAEPGLRGPSGGSGVDLVRSSPELAREIARAETVVTRAYRLSRETVLGMHAPGAGVATNLQEVVEAFLKVNGVELPEGLDRKVFYNDRTEILLVRASHRQIERIEGLLKVTNDQPAQVKVEMRIAEFNGEMPAEELKEPLQVTKVPGTFQDDLKNADENEREKMGPPVWTKVLTEPQMRVVMRAMEQRKGVDLASAPTITTLSGRMARLAIEETPVITDPPFTAPGKGMKARWSKKEPK